MPIGRPKRLKPLKPVKQAEPVEQVEPDLFRLKLEVMGKTFESTGKDIFEALAALKPDVSKAKGFLTIFKEKEKFRVFLPMPEMIRLFRVDSAITKINQKILAKQWQVLFKL